MVHILPIWTLKYGTVDVINLEQWEMCKMDAKGLIDNNKCKNERVNSECKWTMELLETVLKDKVLNV